MGKTFQKLSRPSIRKLPPRGKIMEHGVTFERLPDGDGVFSVNVMVDGQRIHRVVGRESEGVNRTHCEEFIERVRTEARAGRLSLPKGRKIALTFRKAANSYLERLQESGGKNLEAKRRHLEKHLLPFFGDQSLQAISAFTVDRYKKRRSEAHAKNSSINRDLATLSHLFAKAKEWGWLAQRPKFAKLVEDPGRIVALNDAECNALISASLESADPYCWLFVAFGLNTAMRHGEMLRARFDQLDLDRMRLFVPHAKAGQREQPITPELAEILRREMANREDRNGWIFPSPRPNVSLRGHRHRMDKPFRDAVVGAGLDPRIVTPHVMRHTAITKLVQAGIDLPTIQRISGHKTLAMVMRYTHVHGPHIDLAIRALGRGLPKHPWIKLSSTATPILSVVPKGRA